MLQAGLEAVQQRNEANKAAALHRLESYARQHCLNVPVGLMLAEPVAVRLANPSRHSRRSPSPVSLCRCRRLSPWSMTVRQLGPREHRGAAARSVRRYSSGGTPLSSAAPVDERRGGTRLAAKLRVLRARVLKF